MDQREVIKKPVITEKMTHLGDTLNQFGFIVDARANKLEIKEAIERIYGVSVEKVNTMNYNGKNRVRYTRSGILSGKSPDHKKAVVMLAEGDTIDLYGNI